MLAQFCLVPRWPENVGPNGHQRENTENSANKIHVSCRGIQMGFINDPFNLGLRLCL